jgi:glycosyltransferase involved in cell wall biosynthesis
MARKPRLALFGMAIIGGGPLGEGIPVLVDLFQRLSTVFDITFYSFSSIDKRHVPASIKVKQPVSWRLPGRLKYLMVCLLFVWDHILNRHSLLFAVSVYPTGRWAIILGKVFRRPVIIQMIALEAALLTDVGMGNLAIPWLAKISRWVCEKADVLVAVAEYQKKVAINSLPTSREIIVLPLRINCEKFPYSEHRLTFPVEFIHIAHYSPVKDQETMFAAFAKVVRMIDCHLTVVGDGFNVPRVVAMLRDLSISDKVTFKGFVLQSALPYYFKTAHILLHTARFETGCAVIQEAMASGVVVCGTRVGILDDIGDRYAVIVPPRQPEQLAEKILELVSNPQSYSRMQDEAYKWITAYDAVWAGKNYLSFLETMCSAAPMTPKGDDAIRR